MAEDPDPDLFLGLPRALLLRGADCEPPRITGEGLVREWRDCEVDHTTDATGARLQRVTYRCWRHNPHCRWARVHYVDGAVDRPPEPRPYACACGGWLVSSRMRLYRDGRLTVTRA